MKVKMKATRFLLLLACYAIYMILVGLCNCQDEEEISGLNNILPVAVTTVKPEAMSRSITDLPSFTEPLRKASTLSPSISIPSKISESTTSKEKEFAGDRLFRDMKSNPVETNPASSQEIVSIDPETGEYDWSKFKEIVESKLNFDDDPLIVIDEKESNVEATSIIPENGSKNDSETGSSNHTTVHSQEGSEDEQGSVVDDVQSLQNASFEISLETTTENSESHPFVSEVILATPQDETKWTLLEKIYALTSLFLTNATEICPLSPLARSHFPPVARIIQSTLREIYEEKNGFLQPEEMTKNGNVLENLHILISKCLEANETKITKEHFYEKQFAETLIHLNLFDNANESSSWVDVRSCFRTMSMPRLSLYPGIIPSTNMDMFWHSFLLPYFGCDEYWKPYIQPEEFIEAVNKTMIFPLLKEWKQLLIRRQALVNRLGETTIDPLTAFMATSKETTTTTEAPSSSTLKDEMSSDFTITFEYPLKNYVHSTKAPTEATKMNFTVNPILATTSSTNPPIPSTSANSTELKIITEATTAVPTSNNVKNAQGSNAQETISSSTMPRNFGDEGAGSTEMTTAKVPSYYQFPLLKRHLTTDYMNEYISVMLEDCNVLLFIDYDVDPIPCFKDILKDA